MCYEGSVDLASIDDLNEREALEVQIAEFGQVPELVFSYPHPQRNLALGLYDALYISNSCDKTFADNNNVTKREENSFKSLDPSLSCDKITSPEDDALSSSNCDKPNQRTHFLLKGQDSLFQYDCLCDRICDKCGVCKLCFNSLYTKFCNEKCCSNVLCSEILRRKFIVFCLQSYLCNDCLLSLFKYRSSSQTLSQGFYLSKVTEVPICLRGGRPMSLFETSYSIVEPTTSDETHEKSCKPVKQPQMSRFGQKSTLIDIPGSCKEKSTLIDIPGSGKEKSTLIDIPGSGKEKSTLIDIPGSGKEKSLTMSQSFSAVEDSLTEVTSKVSQSAKDPGSKITELFSLIKSDFTSTLKRGKKDRRFSAAAIRNDCSCPEALGEDHPILLSFVTGLLLGPGLKKKHRDVTLPLDQLCATSWNEVNFINKRLLRVVKVLSRTECFSRSVPSLAWVPPTNIAVLNAGPIMKILDVPSLKQVSSRRVGDFNSSSCLYFPSIGSVLISSHDGSLYSYSSLPDRNSNAPSTNSSSEESPKKVLGRTTTRKNSLSGSIKMEVKVASSAITSMIWFEKNLYVGSIDGKVSVWSMALRPSYSNYKTGSGFRKSCPYDMKMEELTLLKKGVFHHFSCPLNGQEKQIGLMGQCPCYAVHGKISEPFDLNYGSYFLPDSSRNLLHPSDFKCSLDHSSPVSCLSAMPTSRGEEEFSYLVVGLKNGDLVLWNVDDLSNPVETLGCHSSTVNAICWWKGKDLIDLSFSSKDANSADLECTPTKDYDFSSGNFGTDNTCDVVDPNDDWVLVCENIPRDPRAMSRNSSHVGPSASGSIKPRYLLTGGSDGFIKLVSVNDGCMRIVLEFNVKESISSLCWDGRMVVIGGQSGDLILHDLATGTTLSRITAHPGW